MDLPLIPLGSATGQFVWASPPALKPETPTRGAAEKVVPQQQAADAPGPTRWSRLVPLPAAARREKPTLPFLLPCDVAQTEPGSRTRRRETTMLLFTEISIGTAIIRRSAAS